MAAGSLLTDVSYRTGRPRRFGDGRFGGSRYHFLHHAFLECNYGTSPVMPFDHMLGSYRDDPPKFAKVEGDTSKGAIFE